MSETKFTPGPWVTKQNGRYIDCDGWHAEDANSSMSGFVGVSDEYGNVAALVVESIGGVQEEQQEANASLIAAAPEMYAALKEVADLIVESGMDLTFDLDSIQEALAKARGES